MPNLSDLIKFVTLTATQTLTNKTLTSPTIDLANVTSAGDLAVADGGTGASTAAGARTNLGVAATSHTHTLSAITDSGTMASQNSTSVSITGGAISGITDLTVADGGTGASTAAGARTNLGLVIGTNVQAWDADLDTWATKTPPSGAVVGTTDTQTLSNKTLSAATGVFTNKTSASLGTTGAEMRNDGLIIATVSGNTCMAVNRLASDGTLVDFYQATSSEGTISVSGATVSYNNFMGAHYSELDVGNSPREIERGTIVEATGNLVSERHTRQQRLSKFKPSDMAASKAVYGVIDGPAHQDEGAPPYPGQRAFEGRNPVRRQYNIAAVGAGFIRIAAGATVNVGDLIESAGDGTGRVQADDVIRSSTVGKMTSADIVETYADGSTLRPCVLYCG